MGKQSMCAVLCLVAQLSLTLCDPMNCSLPGSSVYGDCPGKNTGVGCHVLLQEILPTQVSNPGLVHCRQILGHLSHEGSPRILKWVVYPFSRDGLRLGFPELQADSLPHELPRKHKQPIERHIRFMHVVPEKFLRTPCIFKNVLGWMINYMVSLPLQPFHVL